VARARPNIAGTWYRDGDKELAVRIRQYPNSLTFTNEHEDTSTGRFVTSSVIVADEWDGGLRGQISADMSRIDWDDGSAWLRSITTTVDAHESMTADWGRDARPWRGRNGERFTLVCESNGTPSFRLWGTEVYRDDSSICTAAVHAGIITTAGGPVTIEIRPGSASYTASTRNGVASRSYGSYGGSFVFVTAATQGVIGPAEILGSFIGGGIALERDTDRPGADYIYYELPAARPELCRAACEGDSKCRAFTYVKPGIQGDSARCWLKSRITDAVSNTCCVSGVKTSDQ
jgi:hypothetical protein